MQIRSKKHKGILIIGCLMTFLVVGLIHAQTERWMYQHDGRGSATSIVYGSNDSVYVAGYITTSNGYDLAVICLDPAGNEAWAYTHDGPGSGFSDEDRANSIVYGSDGNIYATGYVSLPGFQFDVAVISLTGSGNERWTVEMGNPSNTNDQANAIVYGGDDNVYIAGYSEIGISSDEDFAVVKFDTAGNFNAVYSKDGSGLDDDEAYSIVYGADNNLYVAGYSTGSGTEKDFTIISADTIGNERWTYTLDGSVSGEDEAYSIIYGDDGNIYAAGYTTGSNDKDFTVLSLSPNGTHRWDYTYNGPATVSM